MSLKHGESYVIDVSSLDLNCAWWSITVYGRDLFLVPNAAGLYSVNSFQLQHARTEAEAAAATAAGGKNTREVAALPMRIICSPTKPDALRGGDGEVFWLPMPQAECSSDCESDSKSCQSPPRFVLRGEKRA